MRVAKRVKHALPGDNILKNVCSEIKYPHTKNHPTPIRGTPPKEGNLSAALRYLRSALS